jgi:anti-sigma-K factor RskA
MPPWPAATLSAKTPAPKPATAVADLKAKGMAVNEVSPQEVARMREKLTRVNAAIAANVGMELWTETQNSLDKMRK